MLDRTIFICFIFLFFYKTNLIYFLNYGCHLMICVLDLLNQAVAHSNALLQNEKENISMNKMKNDTCQNVNRIKTI